jgi:hypothetical protein
MVMVNALAGAGEIVVSRTVTDLLAGSGIEFADRERALGTAPEVRLHTTVARRAQSTVAVTVGQKARTSREPRRVGGARGSGPLHDMLGPRRRAPRPTPPPPPARCDGQAVAADEDHQHHCGRHERHP